MGQFWKSGLRHSWQCFGSWLYEMFWMLEEWEQKGLWLCKIVPLKNQFVFELFVLYEWLSSFQMNNEILTVWETQENPRGCWKVIRKSTAPKGSAVTKGKQCSWKNCSHQRTCLFTSVMFRLHKLTPPLPRVTGKQFMKRMGTKDSKGISVVVQVSDKRHLNAWLKTLGQILLTPLNFHLQYKKETSPLDCGLPDWSYHRDTLKLLEYFLGLDLFVWGGERIRN